MRQLRTLRLVICMLILVLMGSGYAAAQGTVVVTPIPPATATPDLVTSAPRGTVTGKVTNGTAASPAPANIGVTLLINHENATILYMDTQTAADGSFQFNDVPIVTGYDYVTAALYRDHIFNSAFLVGNASTTTLNLPVSIYELTEDPSVLSISSSEAQLNVQGSTLEVRQVIRFHNSSDRLYTTSKDLGDGRLHARKNLSPKRN